MALATVCGIVVVSSAVSWFKWRSRTAALAMIAAKKRASLSGALSAARKSLPQRLGLDIESRILGMHAHELAAAIRLGSSHTNGLSAVAVMTVYCHRALYVMPPAFRFVVRVFYGIIIFLDNFSDAADAFNAVSDTCFEEALAEAAEVDKRVSAGVPLRPLEGVPISIKDSINQVRNSWSRSFMHAQLCRYTRSSSCSGIFFPIGLAQEHIFRKRVRSHKSVGLWKVMAFSYEITPRSPCQPLNRACFV